MKDLLKVKNPSKGQLIYMKDLYNKDTLINYMVNKWSYKFNRSLSEKEQNQFRKEVKYLGLRTIEVLVSMEDEYLI